MLRPCLHKELIEAGCDEAGRGCLAGPVFAAAVILPLDFDHPLLNDSKKLTEKKRYEIREVIEKEAVSRGVAYATHEEIDEINILNASYLAMHRATEMLDPAPQMLLIDGNRFNPYKNTPHQCIVKGDGKFMNIAAASILAKTYRDDYMLELHSQYPQYKWDQNKGYPTVRHKEAILEFGNSPFHRKSFNAFKQLKLKL